MDYTQLSFSLLSHIFFLFVALSVMYLVIISVKQKEKITSEISQTIEEKIFTLPNTNFPLIKRLVDQKDRIEPSLRYLHNYYNKPTFETEVNDTYVRDMMITVSVSFALLFIVPYMFIRFACSKQIDFKTLLLENVILFGCIGVFEYLFFVNVGLKYVPIVPSSLQSTFVDSSIKYFTD